MSVIDDFIVGCRIEMVINHLEQLKDHVLYGEEQAQEAVVASQSQTLDVAAPGKGMAPRYVTWNIDRRGGCWRGGEM